MSILGALNRQYERLAARGGVSPEGYSTENISYALLIDDDGAVVRCADLRTTTDKKPVGAPLSVPASFKRTIAPLSFFLWDNSKYVLGLGKEKGGKGIVEYPAHFAAFRTWHEKLLAETDDPALLALLRFVQSWTPDQFVAPKMPVEMLDQNLVFRWRGDEVRTRFIHDRPAARLIWADHVGDDAGATAAMCLVTGRHAAAARLHPSIKGVWGAQSSGASLVSFNLDAFESYGKIQGANAPVSKAAAASYGAALNALLKNDGANRTRAPIGDASTVFWAEVDGVGEAAAAAAEGLAHDVLSPPPVTEEGQTAKLRDSLNALARGRAVQDVNPDLRPETRFYVLGLAPNAARLSVRFWHETTLGDFARQMTRHYDDLKLNPQPWKGDAPAPGALLYPVALQEKRENIPPLLGGELMRAILTGELYPRALLAAVLQRIRAGDPINGPRAAICKAWLTRDDRIRNNYPERLSDEEKETYLVGLDRKEDNPGYLLGRLFAVLESAQRAALGKINATIRDRYYGAASATPAAVFPILLRNGAHHIAALRKKNKGGWVDREIEKIMDKLGTVLPRSLTIENQGRFVIGYYHQRAFDSTRTDIYSDSAKADTAIVEIIDEIED